MTWGVDDLGAACVVALVQVDRISINADFVLSAVERTRLHSFAQPEDRRRCAVGAALLRGVAGAILRVDPCLVAVERKCPQCRGAHGRPQLIGTNLHASIAHSGAIVGVAVTAAGPVGLDLEEVTEIDVTGLQEMICAQEERSHVRTSRDLLCYWTRKEAVLKALGTGLTVDPRAVIVSAPDDVPAAVNGPTIGLSPQLAAVSLPGAYVGHVAVLGRHSVAIEQIDGDPLLI